MDYAGNIILAGGIMFPYYQANALYWKVNQNLEIIWETEIATVLDLEVITNNIAFDSENHIYVTGDTVKINGNFFDSKPFVTIIDPSGNFTHNYYFDGAETKYKTRSRKIFPVSGGYRKSFYLFGYTESQGTNYTILWKR